MNHKNLFTMTASTHAREPLYTVEEAAERLKANLSTLRGMVTHGQVTKIFDSKPAKYRLSDFRAAMAADPEPVEGMYQIETNIPLPPIRHSGNKEAKVRALLAVMQPGDSLLVKTKEVAYMRMIATKLKFTTASRTTATQGISRLWRLT